MTVPRSVGLVVDSNSQIPADLAKSLGIEVVAIPVSVGDDNYLEGVDLDADTFWSLLVPDSTGQLPAVTTSLPSPGQLLEAYNRLVDGGAESIVSVHVGEAYSGTINAARLAANAVDVPVELVDTGTASFGIAACVIEAARAVENGADGPAAAQAARDVAARIRSVFIAQAMDFAAGGRFGSMLPATSDDIQVIAAGPGLVIEIAGSGRQVDELCDIMADTMHSDGAPIHVAVGVADPAATPFADGLEQRLRERSDVVDLVVYRVGPSVGAHFGPGTAGGFWYSA